MRRNLPLLPLALVVATAGAAQDADPPASAPAAISAQLLTSKTLYYPGEPLRVRFLLANSSPAAVGIEGPVPTEQDGTALPAGFVFGTPAEPALQISHEGGRPATISGAPGTSQPGLVRIAPHGVLGVEIDLRELHRPLRYSGAYRLEWRPPIANVEPAVLNFRIEPRYDVLMQTDLGTMRFSLFYDQAPRNVENFVDLARNRFYDGTSIHRVVPGFLIQGGSPSGDPTAIRPDGRLIPAEFHAAPFRAGTLAMALKPGEPNSASCQFFITLDRLPDLDGQYTVVGQAADEGTLRTLKSLSDWPTNEKGQPLRPLTIQFVTLVDAEAPPVARQPLSP